MIPPSSTRTLPAATTNPYLKKRLQETRVSTASPALLPPTPSQHSPRLQGRVQAPQNMPNCPDMQSVETHLLLVLRRRPDLPVLSSWKEAGKEHFDALPRAVQLRILRSLLQSLNGGKPIPMRGVWRYAYSACTPQEEVLSKLCEWIERLQQSEPPATLLQRDIDRLEQQFEQKMGNLENLLTLEGTDKDSVFISQLEQILVQVPDQQEVSGYYHLLAAGRGLTPLEWNGKKPPALHRLSLAQIDCVIQALVAWSDAHCTAAPAPPNPLSWMEWIKARLFSQKI